MVSVSFNRQLVCYMRHLELMEVRPIQITEYETLEGINHFSRWFEALPLQAQGRVRARLERVKLGAFGDVEAVGEGVSELRFLQTGPGFRIYFGMRGRQMVILLCGGNKSSQKRDVKLAKQLWSEARKLEVKNEK